MIQSIGVGPTPPGFVRTASGKLLPAQPAFGAAIAPIRKLLIVLPYYAGDKETAEDLASLICELERVRVKDADFMVVSRHDATPFSNATLTKLGEKFDKVHLHACRRRDAIGHPFGANQMFFDVVTLLGQVPSWGQNYYAFLFMEPDCAPTRPGWISELANAYKEAALVRGKSAIGFIHQNPSLHMNGVAVYATDIYRKAPGDKLGGGNPQWAFDIEKAPILLPLAEDTGLIYFEYKRATITPAEVFAPRRFGVVPALWHGVKDGTARAAVRARFISFTDKTSSPRQTVFTYYQPVQGSNEVENNSILVLWAQAWKASGFNPVVLRPADAVKNAHYAAFYQAIQRFPTILNKQTQLNRFLRWIALDSAGGGLLTEFDVIPVRLAPDAFSKLTGFHLTRPRDSGFGPMCLAYVDKPALAQWIGRIQNYDPLPEDEIEGRKSVSDLNVMARCAREDGVQPNDWVMNYGEFGFREAPAVHFTARALAAQRLGNQKKSVLIQKFLAGDAPQQIQFAEPQPEVQRIKVDALPEEPPPAEVDLSDLGPDPEAMVTVQSAPPEPTAAEIENAELKKQMAALQAVVDEMRERLKHEAQPTEPVPVKNKGGRPKGSGKKQKAAALAAAEAAPAP